MSIIDWMESLQNLIRRHVPVYQQLMAVECGPTCLAMILSYHGRITKVAECRARCSVGRDGVTARTLAEVARSYGLRVRAFTIEPHQLEHLPLPAIAHWNFNHYVVVERYTPQLVTIVDPAFGRRELSPEEFDAGLTGVILTLEPGVHFKRQRQQQTSWHVYLTQMMGTKGVLNLLLQILGASLLLQLLGLALPLFTKVLVDRILPFRIEAILPMLGLGMFILFLSQTTLSYLRAALLVYLQGRLDEQLMLGFFEHVLSLPYHFFQQRSSGDMLMRLGSNSVIRETLTNQTLTVLLDGTFVLVYLVILLFQAPLFGVLALLLALLQVGLLVVTTRRVQDLTQQDLVAQADSNSYLVEALTGMATIKASGGENEALAFWTNLFYKHLNVSLKRSQLSAMLDTALTSLRSVTPFLLLWLGASQVLADQMSLGDMLAFNTLALAFLTPLASLVTNGRQWQLIGAHLERLADVIEAEPEQSIQLDEEEPLTGQIELQNVSFRYDEHAPWVLRNVSLSIKPGQKVALVGRTGSGKSTLGMLLLGLYPVTEGEILYNGRSLNQINHRWLRQQFGIILQNPFLFSGSIRQNLTFHNPNVSLEKVVAAAKLAAIDEDIKQMPMGYETILSEGGGGLSGGQTQRLALARALVNDPNILLLDEATSQLDVVTEALVDNNLNQLTNTRIVIAHRLSTIQNADLIFVLEEGTIVESGTHTSLLAQDGYYATLIKSQHLPATSTA
ncbi:MAG: peptidase domain-containing ABC transporter [Anaerolineales bacterium]|nr:peptidase domain-containing ABC transporter [Anaerolineales bacterium]